MPGRIAQPAVSAVDQSTGKLRPQSSGYSSHAGAARTLRNPEDMKHPPTIWTDPFNADYPLPELGDAYAEYLCGRTRPTSKGTVGTYIRGLLSFEKSLRLHGDPLVLASVTPSNA